MELIWMEVGMVCGSQGIRLGGRIRTGWVAGAGVLRKYNSMRIPDEQEIEHQVYLVPFVNFTIASFHS
jgi:hypothetical protein